MLIRQNFRIKLIQTSIQYYSIVNLNSFNQFHSKIQYQYNIK
jgi:hypothetical protein